MGFFGAVKWLRLVKGLSLAIIYIHILPRKKLKQLFHYCMVHLSSHMVQIAYNYKRVETLKPIDAYMRHGLRSRERGSRGIPIMKVDVIVSKNLF